MKGLITAPANIRKAVWFYNLELALLSEGGYRLSVAATTVDDEEPQLLYQELLDERVASIDDALALIKEVVRATE